MTLKTITLLFASSMLFYTNAQLGSCHANKNSYTMMPTKTQFIYSEFGGQIKVSNVTLFIPPYALSENQLLTLSLLQLDQQTKSIIKKLNLHKESIVMIKASKTSTFLAPLTLDFKRKYNLVEFPKKQIQEKKSLISILEDKVIKDQTLKIRHPGNYYM